MTPKLSGGLVCAGGIIAFASAQVKQVPALVDSLGRSEMFERTCGIVGALCLSAGLFLALYGLMTQKEKRRAFLIIHISAVVVLCWVVGMQFGAYIFFNELYQFDPLPNFLPKLVENARTEVSEAKRQTAARYAYEDFGVTLAYRKDNGSLAYYEPTPDDISFQKGFASTAASNKQLKEETIGGQLKQLPWVIVTNLGLFFLTLVIGAVWVALKKPTAESNLQP